jgi:hypothetical protein
MNDSDIQQRFHLLQKEIEATATLLKDAKIDLTATIDSLKLELEIMKKYMERANPGFVEAYPKLKDEIIQAIDPEWLETAQGRKQ